LPCRGEDSKASKQLIVLTLWFVFSVYRCSGTGKTESSKDLAKALGIFCVVFNCSEQINYKTTNKLFSGLAQTGSWACLDEFNRIDIEVLSVIAQQLLQIRQALLLNQSDFNFQGQQIRLKSTFGCIITMNPGNFRLLIISFRAVVCIVRLVRTGFHSAYLSVPLNLVKEIAWSGTNCGRFYAKTSLDLSVFVFVVAVD
jgi:hypothetical protein